MGSGGWHKQSEEAGDSGNASLRADRTRFANNFLRVSESNWRLTAFKKVKARTPVPKSAEKHELLPHHPETRSTWSGHTDGEGLPLDHQVFINDASFFNPDAALEDHESLGILAIPCGLECGETLSTLEEAAIHIFDPALGHCVRLQDSRLSVLPNVPGLNECKFFINIAALDDKGQPSTHQQNKLHLLYHIASGDCILCDCGLIFPDIYRAERYFLPANMHRTGDKKSYRKRGGCVPPPDGLTVSLPLWFARHVSDSRLPRDGTKTAPTRAFITRTTAEICSGKPFAPQHVPYFP
jgi:hypothetical protein